MHVELPIVTRPMMRPSSSHAASISASVLSSAVGVDEGAADGLLAHPASAPPASSRATGRAAVMWEIWRFVVPALNPNERRYAIPFIIAVVVLFAWAA